MRLLALAAAPLVFLGCGGYADFRLPPAPGVGVVPSRWEVKREPVLSRGSQGEWDSVDVLNPSVVRRDGRYWNFYSGFDGHTWHTGLAISSDGLVWTKQGRVLSPDPSSWERGYIAANGSALVQNGEFLYWYEAGDPLRIAMARSRDGRAWTRLPAAVLGTGPRGSWDERGVADPYVVAIDGSFYMFYLGVD